MIDYLKENDLWMGAIAVPVVVALIGLVAAFVKKTGRKQIVRDISGSGNTVINGDVKLTQEEW